MHRSFVSSPAPKLEEIFYKRKGRLDFYEQGRLDFSEWLCKEITLASRRQRKSNWPEEILIFLNECSVKAIKLGIKGLKIRAKFKLREKISN